MPVYGYGIKRNPLFWQGNKIRKAYRYGNLVYQSFQWSQGAFTSLATGRWLCPAAAVPNGNVILVAGGATGKDTSTYLSSVEMFTEAGVRSTVDILNRAKNQFAGCGYGNYALFAGGAYSSLYNENDCECYNSSGVRTLLSSISYTLRNNAAAVAGEWVLFAGGRHSALLGQYATVDAYNQSGTKTTLTDLAYEVMDHGAASCNGYAFFGFGSDGSSYPTGISIYNASLVRTTTLSGAEGKRLMAVTRCGDGVIFAGGIYSTSNVMRSTVEHVTTLGVRTTLSPLSVARYSPMGGTLNDMAVIAGGSTTTSQNGTTTVDVYDKNKVKTTSPFSLATARSHAAYETLNNTLYLFGGRSGGSTIATSETISYK